MYSLHIGDGRPVVAIFIVSMDLKVWQSCVVAGRRHQIAAVPHEVVSTFVKSGIMWIARCNACGSIYRNNKEKQLLIILLQIPSQFHPLKIKTFYKHIPYIIQQMVKSNDI